MTKHSERAKRARFSFWLGELRRAKGRTQAQIIASASSTAGYPLSHDWYSRIELGDRSFIRQYELRWLAVGLEVEFEVLRRQAEVNGY